MKNFKKLFSIVAIAAILGMAVPTTVLGAATYSDELQGAYDYAYSNGITTMSSIENANMYGSLTRVAMAKMMANYAMEVLGRTPDTSLTCEFPDVSIALDAQYDNGVTNACQLGLMGVGIDHFNPTGLVTRAEFGTVLSRALYGNTYNVTTNPYWAEHLPALKAAGIMNMIDTPAQLEVRGYVMLMMQRADDGVGTPEICTTPENVLSCSLGLDTCPTECQAAQENKVGTLSVSSVGASYTSIPNTGAVKFATVTFTAGASDVNVYGVTFEKEALSTIPTASRLYFEKDGARVTSKASFSENKATVSFSTALEVKAGASETVDLYMLLSGSTVGNEYQFASTYVDSSAATINGTIVTPLMRTLSYDIATLTLAANGTDATYKVDATKLVELGQFSLGTFLNRTDKDLTFKAITLNQSGNASLEYLTDLGLYRDDVKVSTSTTVDGRNVSFVLNDTIDSASASTIYYVVKAKIANAERIGDTYQFTVRYPENTLVEEVGTNFKATITNGTTILNLALNTINGADLKWNQPATSYTKDVVPGTLAVVFYTGTVSSLVSVTLQNPTLTFTGGALTGDSVLRTIYLKIGNTVMSASAPSTLTTGNVVFDGSVTINGTMPVSVYADIKDTAAPGSVKFTNTISLLTFAGPNEYNDNGQAVTSSIGTLSPITINIVGASLSMTNTYSNAQNVQKGDRDIKLADLKFSTTTDVISKLSSFKADLSGSTWTNFQGGTVTVYDEAGVALVSDTITSGTHDLSFVLPNVVNVAKTDSAIFTLRLDLVANAVASPDTLKLLFDTGDVVAKNFITNNPINPTADAVSSVLSVVDAGTVTNVATSFTPRLVQLNGTTVSLGTVKFTPYNGAAYLKSMYLSLSGYNTGMYTELTLQDSGLNVATFVDNGSLPYFTNLSTTALLAGVTKTYTIVATLNNAATSGNLSTGFTINLITGGFESMNGIPMISTGVGAASSRIEFVKAKPTVSYVSSSKGGLSTYTFRVAANGGNISIDRLALAISNNLAVTSTGTLYLTQQGGTTLGTPAFIATGNSTIVFGSGASLSGDVIITNGSYLDFVLEFPVSTWYVGSNPGNIGIEVANIGYYDTFIDGTSMLHPAMFDSYKWDIAPVSTLVTLE